MIEKTIRDYLKEKLGLPVILELPELLPEEFVVVDKTGSSRKNYINTATFAIQSYARSMEKAAEINEKVKVAMDHSVTLCVITKASLNSDYNYTDTAIERYRYQAIYDLTHYET